MGIFDDMENLIIDHFSVTKRHNVQQTFEVTNGNGQQISLQGQVGTEHTSRQGLASQRSQIVSVTQQGQITNHSARNERGSLSDIRGALSDNHGSLSELRGFHSDNRGSSSDIRGSVSDIRGSASDVRGSLSDVRGSLSDVRGSLSDVRGSVSDIRGSLSDVRGSNSDIRGSVSCVKEIERSPPLDRAAVPSSPFRERIVWNERAGTPASKPEQHRSPPVQHAGLSSPYRNRQRASWLEQSNIHSGCAEQRRSFSFEQVCSSPGLRRAHRNSTSSEHQQTPQSEYGPSNSPFRVDQPRSAPAAEFLPVHSPPRPERNRVAHPEHIPPTSPLKCGCRSAQADNAKNTAISAERQLQQGKVPLPKTSGSPQLVRHNIDVSVTSFSKPKLIRLRSEPCTLAAAGPEFVARVQCQEGCVTRRRREELRRSQSFEASCPSRQETLWTGINMPSQLVITRPQLSRSKLNRKHLSLHLEGVSGDLNSLRLDQPLLFHDTHGDNIVLQNNKTRARRHESFCKGICFSNRPIAINEKVYVKFVETNTSWSGVLRFGFTSVNPSSLRGCDLPRYACPDLTNKPGNWAKALGERYTASNILLHFSVSRAGDVTYGVNGEEKGIFFSGVVTSQPLWAMLDIYGNTVGVEFSHANAEIEPPANASQFDASPLPMPMDSIHFNFSSLSLNGAPSSPTGLTPQPPVIQWHAQLNLSPLQFHRLLGRNVRVNTDRTIAIRMREEYCNAFVFTARPIRFGETVVIQVLSIDRSFIGGLGFGLTACDPSLVDSGSLPDDSDLLLDRLEYWVVNKDVCRNPEVGDELSFHLSESGEVKYARNNQAPVTLMHVDRTLPLWAFFDVYGNIQKIKLIGTTMTAIQGRLGRPQSLGSYPSNLINGGPAVAQGVPTFGTSILSVALPSSGAPVSLPAHVLRSNSVPMSCVSSGLDRTVGHPTSLPATPLSPTGGLVEEGVSDCKVCMERVINSVLYTCGHMCLCYECAMAIRSEKGLCPICRQPIADVIKFYKS